MNKLTRNDIADMTATERLELIGELWDSLDEKDVELSSAQRAELERRLENFEADRHLAISWDDLSAELLSRSSAKPE